MYLITISVPENEIVDFASLLHSQGLHASGIRSHEYFLSVIIKVKSEEDLNLLRILFPDKIDKVNKVC